MKISFSNESVKTVDCEAVAIAIAKDKVEQVTSLLGAQWTEALQQEKFTGKIDDQLILPSLGVCKAKRLIFVGAGNGTTNDIRRALGNAGFLARTKGASSVAVHSPDLTTNSIEPVVSGFFAGNYRYDRFKMTKDRKAPTDTLCIMGPEDQSLAAAAIHLVNARNLARDLVNGPADVIYPESLAQVARELADDNITVTVWDEHKIKSEGMGGITAVGQGSSNPARFIHLHYKPTGTPRKKIALVGKGVTFDSGGLSLKSSAGMQTMRCDMAGSASVIGAFKGIKHLQPDVEVHGLIGAVENMCAANSYKLGDILTIYNGKTVEIHNTDAEGRLVLADCLSYGSKLGVDYMVDLATLTGACVVALGEFYSALYTNDDALAADIVAAANQQDEGVWRMPFPDFYKEKLKADWAHIKNVGGRAAGSITAGLFLSEFVTDTKWAHLDIAGPAFFDKKFRYFTSGGTGAMVESLLKWIDQ